MLYVRENAGLLHQHYEQITGENVSKAILPTIYNYSETDEGQGEV
jgi:hypothetical protein